MLDASQLARLFSSHSEKHQNFERQHNDSYVFHQTMKISDFCDVKMMIQNIDEIKSSGVCRGDVHVSKGGAQVI